MTKSCQKLANSYQTYLKFNQINFYVINFVIKYSNQHTFVAFFYILTHFVREKMLPSIYAGEQKGTFFNSELKPPKLIAAHFLLLLYLLSVLYLLYIMYLLYLP